MSAEQVEELRTHLGVVKQSPTDKIDDDLFNFMLKAKDTLGETNYHMAEFYYFYSNFLLQKIEANLDLFNTNALPDNAHQDEPSQIEENVAEEYADQSESEAPVAPASDLENVLEGQQEAPADQPQIVEGEEGAPAGEHQSKEEEEDINDKEIILLNFRMAQRLFEDELAKIRQGISQVDVNEVLDGLKRTLTRTGDLYLMDEDYNTAIECYQRVVEQENQREGCESNRFLSQLHLLIGNSYLYQNGSECEEKALQEYIKAVNILLGYLSITLNYDISGFEIPSREKTKVDRFSYMSLAGDQQTVKDTKDIIGQILDKIEDTHSQLLSKDVYNAEKQKMVEDNKNNHFKPVSESTKVVHLGNFGNRKKKPANEPVGPTPPQKTVEPLQESKENANSNQQPSK